MDEVAFSLKLNYSDNGNSDTESSTKDNLGSHIQGGCNIQDNNIGRLGTISYNFLPNRTTSKRNMIILIKWICTVGQRYKMVFFGLFFICITIQALILAVSEGIFFQSVNSIQTILKTGTDNLDKMFDLNARRLGNVYEKGRLSIQQELAKIHDEEIRLLYLRDNQERGKELLIPHENEWKYVKHDPDVALHHSKKNTIPTRLLYSRHNEHQRNLNCLNAKSFNFNKLLICNYRKTTPFAVLSTTMHPKKDKMFIFKNTINSWSAFFPEDVLPVLYISSLEEFQNNTSFLSHACAKGWMVLRVPECSNNRIPIFKSMMQILVKQFPHAKWHGYANGDILFDDSLVATLKFLSKSSDYMPISLALGRRYSIKIPQSYEIKNHLEYQKLFYNQTDVELESASLVDYFITQNGKYDWEKVPPFVIGRIQYDSWMVHDGITTNKHIIDVTETVRAGHQYDTTQDIVMNSHLSAKTDINYNTDILKKLNISINLSICYTSCVSLKTMLVEEKSFTNSKSMNQAMWMKTNFKEAWSETDTLNKIGDPFFPRLHTIPYNSAVYVKAIATRYGIYEEDVTWINQRKIFDEFPKLGINKDRARFLKICGNHGANTRRQMTYINLIDSSPATEWKLWFRK